MLVKNSVKYLFNIPTQTPSFSSLSLFNTKHFQTITRPKTCDTETNITFSMCTIRTYFPCRCCLATAWSCLLYSYTNPLYLLNDRENIRFAECKRNVRTNGSCGVNESISKWKPVCVFAGDLK